MWGSTLPADGWWDCKGEGGGYFKAIVFWEICSAKNSKNNPPCPCYHTSQEAQLGAKVGGAGVGGVTVRANGLVPFA